MTHKWRLWIGSLLAVFNQPLTIWAYLPTIDASLGIGFFVSKASIFRGLYLHSVP